MRAVAIVAVMMMADVITVTAQNLDTPEGRLKILLKPESASSLEARRKIYRDRVGADNRRYPDASDTPEEIAAKAAAEAKEENEREAEKARWTAARKATLAIEAEAKPKADRERALQREKEALARDTVTANALSTEAEVFFVIALLFWGVVICVVTLRKPPGESIKQLVSAARSIAPIAERHGTLINPASHRKTLERQLSDAIIFSQKATRVDAVKRFRLGLSTTIESIATWPIRKIKDEWQFDSAGCLLIPFIPLIPLLLLLVLLLACISLVPVALVALTPSIMCFTVWFVADFNVIQKILSFCGCCLVNVALAYVAFRVIKRQIIWQIGEIDRSRDYSARCQADAIRAIAREYFETLDKLDDLIIASDTSISRAKTEFSQDAFASFWNAIDDAIQKLFEFEQTALAIGKKHSEYESKLSGLAWKRKTHTFPAKLQISASDVPDPQTTLKRLERYVRKGETDFRFASILEQRMTRRVLMAGFQSVDAAIQHLQINLVTSLANIQLILATR